MIIEVKENEFNIFNSNYKFIVNPVNCVGVMGKGLALEFKKKFSKNYKFYMDWYLAGDLRVGQCFFFHEKDRVIINFPTKLHWKDLSKISYIEDGLKSMVEFLNSYEIRETSLAIPKLGCGLGGLDYKKEVKPLIYKYCKLISIPEIRIYISE